MEYKEIINLLQSIKKEISVIKDKVADCTKQKLPYRPGWNPLGKRKLYNRRLMGGLKVPEIRNTILQLKREGMSCMEMERYIKQHWPDQPALHVSKSAINSFIWSGRQGRLREYGIQPEDL